MEATIEVPEEVLVAYPDTGLGKLLASLNDSRISIHYNYPAGMVIYRLKGSVENVLAVKGHFTQLMAKYEDEKSRRHSSSDSSTTVGSET